MFKQKEDIINALSTAFIVVLLLFVFSSWTDHPLKETESAKDIELQLVSQIQYRSASVEPVVHTLSSPEKVLTLLDGFDIGNQLTITVCNKISQRIFTLQKTQLSTIPENTGRFYYHLFPKDAEDLPDLS